MIVDAGLRAAQAEFVQRQWETICLPANVPSWRAIKGVNVAPVYCSAQGPVLQLVHEVANQYRGKNSFPGGKVDRYFGGGVPPKEEDEKKLVLNTLFGELLEEMRIVLPKDVQVLGCFGLPYYNSFTLLCVLRCQMPSDEEFKEAVHQDRGRKAMSQCLKEVGGIASRPLNQNLLRDPSISDYVRSNTHLLLQCYHTAAAAGMLTNESLMRLTGEGVRLTTVPAKWRGTVFQAVKAGKLARPSVFMGVWLPIAEKS